MRQSGSNWRTFGTPAEQASDSITRGGRGPLRLCAGLRDGPAAPLRRPGLRRPATPRGSQLRRLTTYRAASPVAADRRAGVLQPRERHRLREVLEERFRPGIHEAPLRLKPKRARSGLIACPSRPTRSESSDSGGILAGERPHHDHDGRLPRRRAMRRARRPADAHASRFIRRFVALALFSARCRS